MNAASTARTLAMLLLVLEGCGSVSSDPKPTEEVSTSFRGRVTYALHMRDDKLTRDDDGAWSAVNDQGVQFRVKRGGFIIQNLQLTTCDPLHRGHQHGRWVQRLLLDEAYAGHGGPQDPSAVTIPRYMNVAQPEGTPLSIETTADGLYCGVHFLVGMLRGEVADGAEAPVELQGHSLWLEGTWRVPNTEADIAFRIQATEAFGVRTELFEDMPSHLNQSFSSVQLTGHADRAVWFDGVNPQKMDQRAIRRLILRNVVESIQWTASPSAKTQQPIGDKP